MKINELKVNMIVGILSGVAGGLALWFGQLYSNELARIFGFHNNNQKIRPPPVNRLVVCSPFGLGSDFLFSFST